MSTTPEAMVLAKPPVLPELQQAFANTEASLNSRFVERYIFVRLLVLALVGKLDIFGLGIPGVAKSAIVKALAKHVADFPRNGYFQRLLTNFSTPPELFGPWDLKAMDEGIWKHYVRNTLVEAHFVLLDEIFEGNSSILNALLTVLNEREFLDYDTIELDDLWIVVGLSNKTPDHGLNAMYDRLDLRVRVPRIAGSSSFIEMLKGRELRNTPVAPTLTVDGIKAAQAAVQEMPIDPEVFDAVLQLRRDLDSRGIEVSDRRYDRSLIIPQAAAWLRGAEVATIEDMEDLRFTYWETEDHIPIVDTLVLQLASPLEAKALELQQNVFLLAEEHQSIFGRKWENESDRNSAAMDTHPKIKSAIEELKVLQDLVTPGRRSTTLGECEKLLKNMNADIVSKVFGLDPTKKRRGRAA